MRLDVETGLDRPFAKALLAGELDLAVAAATEPDSPDLVTEEIARERWVVVGARTDERLARAQDLGALAGARWLLGRNMGALEAVIARTFLEAGLAAPDAMVRTTSAPFALQALAGGPWLSILPKTLAEQSPGLQMRDLGGPDWSTPLILMRRKSTRGPDLARMLADRISASCRAN
jgi:DNA-binding transcriptional LysR family regulator